MEKKKILFVDDDPKFVDAVKVILDSAGYETIVAYDGIEGEQKLKEVMPDLIILDVMMPRKDGFVLCKEIKNDDELKTIPVVLLTAVGEKIPYTRYSIRDGMDIEAEDYIPKPVEPQELLNRIKELIK